MWAIDTIKLYKSSGTDGIVSAPLQQFQEYLITHILHVSRSCITTDQIPKSWRLAKYIPKKVGKTSSQEAKLFRPFSLTSFLLKTKERLVDYHLREGAIRNYPIHPYRDRSTFSDKKGKELAIPWTDNSGYFSRH